MRKNSALYEKNGRNVSATARHFDVAPKRVPDWRDSKEKIEKQAVGSRAAGRGRTSFYPLMEKRLYDEFAKKSPGGKAVTMKLFLIELVCSIHDMAQCVMSKVVMIFLFLL